MLSVVVSSRNRCEHLGPLLDALRGQDVPPESFEVVVVLDGSTDGSAELLRQASTPFRLSVVEQPHRGLAAARNAGVAAAAEPLVLFLDDDLRPRPGLVRVHAAAHADAKRPQFVLGYCPPRVPDTGYEGRHLRDVWEHHYRRKAAPHHRWTFVDFADGNVSFPKSLFNEHGGFDESFAGRRQDWELGVRLLDAGTPLQYVPAAEAVHLLDGRLETRLRHVRDEGRSDVLLARKHPHVTGRLRLAAAAEAMAANPARRAHYHALRIRPLARTRPALHALEAVRAQRAWDRLAGALVGEAYLAGIRELLPGPSDLTTLAAPALAGRDTEVVPLDLDTRDLPAISGTRPVEFVLSRGGRELGRVPAFEPGAPWDRDRLEELIAERLAP